MRQILCVFLIVIGFFQMLGHVFRQPWLKGIGQILIASPLPIVFTQQKGIETFASDFFLEFEDVQGVSSVIPITHVLYKLFHAPYNYRNVIGAAISYGPILPEPVWQSILFFAFQSPGKVSKALRLNAPLSNLTITIKTKTRNRMDVWRLKVKSDAHAQ